MINLAPRINGLNDESNTSLLCVNNKIIKSIKILFNAVRGKVIGQRNNAKVRVLTFLIIMHTFYSQRHCRLELLKFKGNFTDCFVCTMHLHYIFSLCGGVCVCVCHLTARLSLL